MVFTTTNLPRPLAPVCAVLVVGAGSYWIVERTFLAGH
jgi:hypothetical protein